VLDFASGSGWCSEWLNRLGCHTVGLDVKAELLGLAKDRLALDQRVQPDRASFVLGDGQRLPFANAIFDGVICMNALHHMPDYEAALFEICRILKPGRRAVFSEPGSDHANAAESKMVVEQYGEVEKNIVLEEVYQIARQVGFDRMIVRPLVYPEYVDLDYRALGAYQRLRSAPAPTGLGLPPLLFPENIVEVVEKGHPIFALIKPGEPLRTSARPGLLRASLRLLDALPETIHPGQRLRARLTAHNEGDTIWLCQPSEWGGHVTLGAKLCLSDGRLLADTLDRTLLSQDVLPGDRLTLQADIKIPETLEPGHYLLAFDLVAEQIAWFRQLGSAAIEHRFNLIA
jgi:SAM-dependent methyltransferase